MSTTRRDFLKAAAGISAAAMTARGLSALAAADERLHVAVNTYTCGNIYGRDGKNFWEHLPELKDAGIDGLEPSASNPIEAEGIWKAMTDRGMQMRSIYTVSNFHTDDATTAQELERMTGLAQKLKELDTRIIVGNVAQKTGKTDAEIRRQSAAFEVLGRRVADLGMKLGIHYHTSEWDFGGREYLHLMATTDPALVGCCFDLNWSYHGSGNSVAAVEAHMRMFAKRTVEFHLRQTINSVWSETFGDGDIDYAEVVAYYKAIYGDNMPHVVLEQLVGETTPKTLTAAEIFKQSAEYTRKIFG